MRAPHKPLGRWLLLGLVVVGFLSSCSVSTKAPIFFEPGFSFTVVDQIVILPPIDSRIDKKINVNLQKQIQARAEKILVNKGYPAKQDALFEYSGEIVEEELKEADPEWIKSFGPEGSRWVLVLCLVDVTTKLVFGSTGNAEITGYLFDTESGRLIWRDKGIGQAGQGGLVGMIMKGTMDETALSGAMNNLFLSLPKRKA